MCPGQNSGPATPTASESRACAESSVPLGGPASALLTVPEPAQPRSRADTAYSDGFLVSPGPYGQDGPIDYNVTTLLGWWALFYPGGFLHVSKAGDFWSPMPYGAEQDAAWMTRPREIQASESWPV